MSSKEDRFLHLREWVVIFIILSSIVAVIIVGEVKARAIKTALSQTNLRKGKDFIVKKSDLLLFCPPMNHSPAT